MSTQQTEQKPRILVVEDDPMVREVVVESIETAGYKVDVCADGGEALHRNGQQAYDVIVTDMRLPGMDGLSLIRELKAGASGTDVMVITGYGTIENAVECMKAGALEYLIKPFTVEQIQMAVNKVVEHRELKRRAFEREYYRELSYIDGLTRIHNRRYFDEAFGAELQKAGHMGTSLLLLMIDIDDFKIYNDRNGHLRGDEALTKIGKLLKSACRVYDIVTRYGGEEFAIVFPGATSTNAHELAERIMHAVRDAKFEGEDLLPTRSLTVSVGAALFPDHASTVQGLILAADEALYAAKNAGKNKMKLHGTF
jgi:diguanylate cyclase (GGDEF)-like protein